MRLRLIRGVLCFCALLFVLGLSVFDVQAAKAPRVALVIGNSNYQFAPLANPVNDAKLISKTLRGLGFEVLDHYDINQKSMKRAILNFGDRLEELGKDTVGLFYYAGHGVQVRGNNYLIPIDAEIDRERDVDIEALSAQSVLGTMAYAENRLNFIIMDACRNNPFKRSFRSASRGLARMDAPRGSMIAYATAPGDVAADGRGKNSPYTAALSKIMQQPGLSAESMFKRVRIEVMRKTKQRQVPWEASSLTGDFYFNPILEKPKIVTKPSGATAEMVFWQSIQNSDNPDSFQAYINRYPKGDYISLAKVNLRHLKKAAERPQSPTIMQGPNPETVFWQAIQNTSDATLFQSYLRKYPKGEYIVLARTNIKRIAKARAAGKGGSDSESAIPYPTDALNFDGEWTWKINYSRGRGVCHDDRTRPMVIEDNRIVSAIVYSDGRTYLTDKVDEAGKMHVTGYSHGEGAVIDGMFKGKEGRGTIEVSGDALCEGTWVATWTEADK